MSSGFHPKRCANAYPSKIVLSALSHSLLRSNNVRNRGFRGLKLLVPVEKDFLDFLLVTADGIGALPDAEDSIVLGNSECLVSVVGSSV